MQSTSRMTGWGSMRESVSCWFPFVPEKFSSRLANNETEPNKSKLSEGKHAQCCLRYSKDVHGPRTVHLVPVYLLLAEADMGLGDLAQVTELLAQAEWAVVLKSPEHSVHHRLHRSLGRLHAATGNLEAALFSFANDVRVINEAQRVEVRDLLKSMLEFEQNYSRKDSAQVALVAHCLAMLWFLRGDTLKWVLGRALAFGSTALQASRLIPNHDLTEPIQGLLQLVQSLQTEPHTGSD
ncbi:hypothetical protein VZT92_026144 [Zoarces viviparus]|uniref:Uncharacterized protein n=1 Tax=Zoarces viviparus TaxID=48416 RepID=A0AAW1E0E8_ZOAVI